VGGTLGTILAGVFATTEANPNLAAPRIQALVGHSLWIEQLKAGAVVLLWSVVATAAIVWLLKMVMGSIRASAETETVGLDLSEHGEEGYHH
jgi:Amt family ammonium transporter